MTLLPGIKSFDKLLTDKSNKFIYILSEYVFTEKTLQFP